MELLPKLCQATFCGPIGIIIPVSKQNKVTFFCTKAPIYLQIRPILYDFITYFATFRSIAKFSFLLLNKYVIQNQNVKFFMFIQRMSNLSQNMM